MKSKSIALYLGPFVFALFHFLAPTSNQLIFTVAGITLWMLLWWILEVVNLAVTALLPMVLFPMFNVLPIKEVAVHYANPIVYLFFGGFVVALALEKWNLHKRVALHIVLKTGTQPYQVLLGFMLATAFLSMWISNTATTVMMLPIALSVIQMYTNKTVNKKVGFTLLLGVAWAANIGGIATLIGTPPNLLLAAYVKENNGVELYFSQWLAIGLPIAFVLFTMAFLLLKRQLPKNVAALNGNLILLELKEMGKISSAEKRLTLVFVCTAMAWILRPLLVKWPLLQNLNDTIIALIAAVVLFIIPSKKNSSKKILVWKDTEKLPWGILVLFGGGLALAKGLSVSGLLDLLSQSISELGYLPLVTLILIFTIIGVFLTELISNMAFVAAALPLVDVVALSFGLPFLNLAVAITIGASCAFMLPTATPPNAIVFSSNKISISEMMKLGLWMNLWSVLIITGILYLLVLYVI